MKTPMPSKIKFIFLLILAFMTTASSMPKTGNLPHETAVEVLTSGLIRLGLLVGEPADLTHNKSYQKFFMQGMSHWLGLDVHDAGGWVGENGKTLLLQAGMLLTVEPGIYIEGEFGIRIEDMVVMQNGKAVVL